MSYSNRNEERSAQVKRIIDHEVLACQSSLVDMLLKSEIDGWSIDDVENLHIDPSEWDLAECLDYAKEYGIRLESTDEDDIEAIRETIRDNAEPNEPLEWWLVSATLLRDLREIGEVVIDNDYGYWWGRTTSGQMLEMDSVWDQVCDLIDERYKAAIQ